MVVGLDMSEPHCLKPKYLPSKTTGKNRSMSQEVNYPNKFLGAPFSSGQFGSSQTYLVLSVFRRTGSTTHLFF